MKKLLTLWRALWSGEETTRDERTKEVLRSTWLLVLGVGCLLLLGVTVYYLVQQEVNRTQLAAGITAIMALLAGGLGLSCCFRGVLRVADRWSGRLVVLAGVLSMAVHWGMLVPVRQYFHSSIFFVDFLLIGAVVFYLLCNGAYCAYETLWSEREAAQNAADTAEMEDSDDTFSEKMEAENPGNAVNGMRRTDGEIRAVNTAEMPDADLLEQLAIRFFRKKRGVVWMLFAAAIVFPAWLQKEVFSDQVMGQVQRQYEISEEAARTPEYQELEALAWKWQNQLNGDYALVSRGTLRAKFFREENPSYADGGCLYLKTDEMQMRIGFADGELVQSEYTLPDEEDYLRANYLYHNGSWEREEDIEAAQHHQDPAYPVSLWDYALEDMTGWTVEISPLWMKDNVEVTTRDGMMIYRYAYSEEYLKELTKDLGKDEQSSWMVVEALEMTADADGNPVACTWELRHKAEGTKELTTERLTGQFLPDVDVAGLQEEMCASGPYVPEEAQKIWEEEK